MSNALQLIAAERERQIAKGYDAKHDDGHKGGDMALLAAMISAFASVYCSGVQLRKNTPEWVSKEYQRLHRKYAGNRIERLTDAGALIVAEIERLQRAAKAEAATNDSASPRADAERSEA